MQNTIQIENIGDHEILVSLTITARQARKAYRALIRKAGGPHCGFWRDGFNVRAFDYWKIEESDLIGWVLSRIFYDCTDGLDYTNTISIESPDFWAPAAKEFRELIA